MIKPCLIILTCCILAACERAPEENAGPIAAPYSATSPATVLTVNYPLQYLAERVGGEFVQALYPGPANADPAYWKPDVETVIEYQQADLILINGAGYAGWTQQVSLPLAKQVDTSAAFTDLLLPITDKAAHTHGPTGEHVHDDVAFTVWLDPELAKLQATAIHDALAPLLAEQKTILGANLIALADSLWLLDEELARTFKFRNRQQIIYSHPVYQYFDRRYELNGISVHWEPDELPSDKEFAKLKDMAGALMIWEADPLPETEAKLAAMGIAIVVFDPCATKPASGDYLGVMQANLQRLKTAVL
jgi:zinc transport system substrate-binding protein